MTNHDCHMSEIRTFCSEWKKLADYTGDHVPEPNTRILSLVRLWRHDVSCQWRRKSLPANFGGYRRKLDGKNVTPEHELEKELFAAYENHDLKIEGYESLDLLGNAFPLANKRTVEADLIAIGKKSQDSDMLLVEVKNEADNAWHAVVENLLQLKLFKENYDGNLGLLRSKFSSRVQGNPTLRGLVLAPEIFFEKKNKQFNAKKPAFDLATRFRDDFGVQVLLGRWEKQSSEIKLIHHV